MLSASGLLAYDIPRARWQPHIRAQARRQAATTTGVVIDARARFGFTAAPGSSDDARVCHLTIALPPHYAARLFDAQAAGASEQQLRDITAEGRRRARGIRPVAQGLFACLAGTNFGSGIFVVSRRGTGRATRPVPGASFKAFPPSVLFPIHERNHPQ